MLGYVDRLHPSVLCLIYGNWSCASSYPVRELLPNDRSYLRKEIGYCIIAHRWEEEHYMSGSI